MNLNQLKYFHAICTHKSVSVAAAYLYISQPSLSSALKALENEFGVALFKRHHHGMELTQEGKMLFNMCDELLENARHIENVMMDLGKKKKTLRLGIPPMIGLLVLPRIYGCFLAENPDIKLDITEGGQHELLQKLSNEYLDIAILPHNHSFEQELATQAIIRLEIVCCVSKNHELARLPSVRPIDLAEVPVVLFKNSFFQTEEIKRWYVSENVTPKICLQTAQLSTMQNMIAGNLAAGFMFKSLAEAKKDLVPLPLEKPVYVDVSLVWKKESFSFDAVTKFKEFVKETGLF